MKKLLLTLCVITGLSLGTKAQITQKTPEQRAAHITRVLQKKLNLTASQASQVNSVFLKQAASMDSLKNNRSADQKTNQLTRRSIFLTTEKHVMAFLNEDQKASFMEWVKIRKEKMRERKSGGQSAQG